MLPYAHIFEVSLYIRNKSYLKGEISATKEWEAMRVLGCYQQP